MLGGGVPSFVFWGQLINLIIMLAVITGFVVIVMAVWKQAKAQEKMAAAFQEIAAKLGQ